MRRVSYPNKKFINRPEGAYSRSDKWTSRYYHRKVGNSTVTTMSGLNVTNSTFEMKNGESPYISNARLQGSKESRVRAQSMSRPGQKFLGAPVGSEKEIIKSVSGGERWFSIEEFRTVRYTISNPDRVTSIGYYLKVEDNESPGYFTIILRDPKTEEELCRTFIPISEIKSGEIHWFRLIRTFKDSVIADITLIDDLTATGLPLGTKVDILFTGKHNHKLSNYENPNVDSSLHETPYVFSRGVGAPLTSLRTTKWEVLPTWIQGGYFASENKRWVPVGVIKDNGEKAVYKYSYIDIIKNGASHQRITSEVTEMIPASKLDQSCERVRMTQAGDALYYVDGISPLRRVKLGDWKVEDAVPTTTDLLGFVPEQFYYRGHTIFKDGKLYQAKADFTAGSNFDANNWNQFGLEDYTAWKGASLIYFLNNRLFLAGFYRNTVGVNTPKSEPNLVIMSSIDSIAPKYDFFNKSVEFFHTPDRSPSSTATSPITGFADLNDNLIVFLRDTLSFLSIPSGIEFGSASQTTPVGSGYGVLMQEHIAQGRNNVFFYNITEGIMRLGGTMSTVISKPIDALLKRIKNPEKVSLQVHKSGLRVYYHEDGSSNNKSLYCYYTYAAQKSYWFHDINTPISSMNSDKGYDVEIGVGSEYPCIIEAEADGSSDFDCAIEYEYHTNYIGTPGTYNRMIVRRVYVTSTQDFNGSLYIGLDIDQEDRPIVWRRYIQADPVRKDNPSYIMRNTDSKGLYTAKARILTSDADMAQIRIKQYCYNSQAHILKCGFQYGEGADL